MNKISIFTDGASRGNPGPGGWGTVIIFEHTEKTKVVELGGAESATTNNRMELTAAIMGIFETQKIIGNNSSGFLITVYSDSSYVINGITKWVYGWKRNGWLTKTKEDVLNKDLWMRLSDAASGLKINWQYVGGHIGIKGNERCDEIATSFADGKKPALFNGDIEQYSNPDILNIEHDSEKLENKKSGSGHSKAKAYSYVSMVDKVIQIHKTWPECEKRVKGAKGAKFKKSLNPADEASIVSDFRSL